MDPSTPYRRSWMPFGRTGRSQAMAGSSTSVAARQAVAPRRRIPMAPVQLNRWMYQPPAAPAVPAAAPAPAPRSSAPRPALAPAPRSPAPAPGRQAPGRQVSAPGPATGPATAAPATVYPQGTTPGRASRRANRRATAQVRTARVRTAMPTRVAESVPAPQATTAPASAGATMAAPPPPPTLQLGRSRPPGSRPPGSQPRPTGPAGARPARSDRPPGPGSLPFDPLALGAFFVIFFAPPIALLIAIASLRRAAKAGISPVLSWIALLAAGFATLLSLGLVAAVIDAIQSTAG